MIAKLSTLKILKFRNDEFHSFIAFLSWVTPSQIYFVKNFDFSANFFLHFLWRAFLFCTDDLKIDRGVVFDTTSQIFFIENIGNIYFLTKSVAIIKCTKTKNSFRGRFPTMQWEPTKQTDVTRWYDIFGCHLINCCELHLMIQWLELLEISI